LFDGARIDGMDSQAITRAGAAHVPEGRRVFADQTVDANLALGGWGLGRGRAGQRRRRERADLVYGLFRRLADRRRQRAGSLSGGEQQMLSLGRALMTDPKLLMIDELSLGLAPIFVDELVGKLGELHRDAGVDLLLVEQFVHRALQLADRVYVLEKGRISFFGSAEEVAASGVLESAYQLAMKP
jgi:branched-chain amino acid transport system ATP-binding protein